MTLAQHLLDKGLVRYDVGAWSLPASIEADELPSSMAQALEAQVAALSAETRELAQAMALSADQRFSFEDCVRLSSHREAKRVLASLDRLGSCEIVRLSQERYAIAQESWLAPLRATLEPAAERALHSRLAELFERRGAGLRMAQHLLQAGEQERGLDALIAFSERSQRETDLSTEAFFELLRTLPPGWFECFEQGVSLCERLGRPRRFVRVLRTRQTSMQSTLTGVTKTDALAKLVELLAHAGGLDLAAQLDPALSPTGVRAGAGALRPDAGARSSAGTARRSRTAGTHHDHRRRTRGGRIRSRAARRPTVARRIRTVIADDRGRRHLDSRDWSPFDRTLDRST
jgi:hypothetical protein